MIGCFGSDSCLVLPNEKDLIEIMGVGVLLRSCDNASASSTSEKGSEDMQTYRASIVFVSECIEQVSDAHKAVSLTQYKRLQPNRVRFLGLCLGQNLMSKVGQWLNKRLSNSVINYSQASSSDVQVMKKIDFEVWYINGYQQEPKILESKNTRSISFEYNEKCECSYIETFNHIDGQNERFLWEIAGFLIKKIGQRDRILLEHFGFLVSSCKTEQKKVKDAINKSICAKN